VDGEALAAYISNKLSGGVAVINVGGSGEVEIRIDMMLVTRSTLRVLPSGKVSSLGVAIYQLPRNLKPPYQRRRQTCPTTNFDQDLAVSIIRHALTYPHARSSIIASEESSVIVSSPQYGAPDKFAWGYDAQKGEYMGVIKAGIVDPLKVVRTALMHVSELGLLTTSEACVVDAPEGDRPVDGAGVGGGMSAMGGF
jgi:chaperonin GroEL